jgi:hypothetical protein
LRVKENINGLMAVHTKANGKLIKCMVKVFSHGQMAENTKETILRIKNKDKVLSIGLMGENMLDNGQMENSMEKEHL